MAAIESAAPARPCRAIWWPSRQVTTEVASPGNVDQHRRGRAAILRAVIDAGEHDQRADRRQAEGDRQQHRDGRDGADAGQHADQRADQRADQAEQDVQSGIRRDREAQREIREEFGHDNLNPKFRDPDNEQAVVIREGNELAQDDPRLT